MKIFLAVIGLLGLSGCTYVEAGKCYGPVQQECRMKWEVDNGRGSSTYESQPYIQNGCIRAEGDMYCLSYVEVSQYESCDYAIEEIPCAE